MRNVRDGRRASLGLGLRRGNTVPSSGPEPWPGRGPAADAVRHRMQRVARSSCPSLGPLGRGDVRAHGDPDHTARTVSATGTMPEAAGRWPPFSGGGRTVPHHLMERTEASGRDAICAPAGKPLTWVRIPAGPYPVCRIVPNQAIRSSGARITVRPRQSVSRRRLANVDGDTSRAHPWFVGRCSRGETFGYGGPARSIKGREP